MALLYVLLEEWKAGVDMGGRKTRGLGRVVLESYQVRWIEDLTAYLLGEAQKEDQKAFEADLKSAFRTFANLGGVSDAQPHD